MNDKLKNAVLNVPELRFPEFSGDWVCKKLGDVADIKSGMTPLRSTLDFFRNGTIHWVKTLDLVNGDIDKTDECITEKALNETSIKIYPIDSVLVAMYGGFNQIGRTGILKVEAATNQALSIILVNKKIIKPIYLINYLNANVFKWRKFAVSSRKDPNITSADVKSYIVYCAVS